MSTHIGLFIEVRLYFGVGCESLHSTAALDLQC